jgi:hypothetical protein
MTDDRSNSAARLDALLAKARQHAANAERHEAQETTARQRKIIDWAACADEIVAKKREAEAEGWNLTNDEIGRAMQWKGDRSVQIILRWRRENPGNPEVITSGPWEDSRSPMTRNAAARFSAARRVAREQPEVIMEEMLKDPMAFDRFLREGSKRRAAQKPKRSPALVPDPKAKSVLRPLDRIEMGGHLLIVGDSTNPHIKWKVLEYLGWLREKKLSEHPSRVEVEMPIVVVTDPPYGQKEPGVSGDNNPYWKDVYDLFKPRGGFSFCAYRPPIFRRAEQGIIDAGGNPIHYLAYQTKGALGQGPEGRLLSELQSIIYWERNGEDPWIRGRQAIRSVLESNEEESREDLKEARKIHATPKPVDVMEKLIGLVTEQGDLVLDPFAGSGSTLIACDGTKRRCIAVELEPILAEGAVQRWQTATDGKAIVYRYPVEDSEDRWQRMPLEEADKKSEFPIKPFSFIAFDDLLAIGERA